MGKGAVVPETDGGRLAVAIAEMDVVRERFDLSIGETLAICGLLMDGMIRLAPALIRADLRRACIAAVNGDTSEVMRFARQQRGGSRA